MRVRKILWCHLLHGGSHGGGLSVRSRRSYVRHLGALCVCVCVNVMHVWERYPWPRAVSNHLSLLSHLLNSKLPWKRFTSPSSSTTDPQTSPMSSCSALTPPIFSATVFRWGLAWTYEPDGVQPGDEQVLDHIAIFIIALFIVLIMLRHTHTKQRCVWWLHTGSKPKLFYAHRLILDPVHVRGHNEDNSNNSNLNHLTCTETIIWIIYLSISW